MKPIKKDLERPQGFNPPALTYGLSSQATLEKGCV